MKQIREVEAFCSSCPHPDEVAALLQEYGLTLTFSMKAVMRRRVEASIPAQYHFEGAGGTAVLYLAGRDVGDGDMRLPMHASRFWAIGGADLEPYRRVTVALSERWALHWQESSAQYVAEKGTRYGKITVSRML